MMQPTYIYKALIAKVVDADTFDLLVDLGLRVTTKIRVRLAGINAPEIGTDDGKLAKLMVLEIMPISSYITVRTYKDPVDKYGRWLAAVEVNGIDLAKWLIDNGHGVEMPI